MSECKNYLVYCKMSGRRSPPPNNLKDSTVVTPVGRLPTICVAIPTFQPSGKSPIFLPNRKKLWKTLFQRQLHTVESFQESTTLGTTKNMRVPFNASEVRAARKRVFKRWRGVFWRVAGFSGWGASFLCYFVPDAGPSGGCLSVPVTFSNFRTRPICFAEFTERPTIITNSAMVGQHSKQTAPRTGLLRREVRFVGAVNLLFRLTSPFATSRAAGLPERPSSHSAKNNHSANNNSWKEQNLQYCSVGQLIQIVSSVCYVVPYPPICMLLEAAATCQA